MRSGFGDPWGIGAGPRWARVALRVSGPGPGSLGRGEAGGHGSPPRRREARCLNTLSAHRGHRSCQTRGPLSRPSRWAAALLRPRASLLRPQKSQDPRVWGDRPALEMFTFKTHGAGQTPHTHRPPGFRSQAVDSDLSPRAQRLLGAPSLPFPDPGRRRESILALDRPGRPWPRPCARPPPPPPSRAGHQFPLLVTLQNRTNGRVLEEGQSCRLPEGPSSGRKLGPEGRLSGPDTLGRGGTSEPADRGRRVLA